MHLFAEYAEEADQLAASQFNPSEQTIAAVALALGARLVAGWSLPEESLTNNLLPAPPALVAKIRNRIVQGEDPLGELFCTLRPPAERRLQGATFTPLPIVQAMLDWAARHWLRAVCRPGWSEVSQGQHPRHRI
jgi:hypothetical protein